MSDKKIKSIAFKGKRPVHSKTIVNEQPVEHVSHFMFLGCDEYENINTTLHKYQMMRATMHTTLVNKTSREINLRTN